MNNRVVCSKITTNKIEEDGILTNKRRKITRPPNMYRMEYGIKTKKGRKKTEISNRKKMREDDRRKEKV